MKYKEEGIKSQIADLKISEYFFKITGTLIVAGASIALVKENGITPDTSIGETISSVGPAITALSGGIILGLSPVFKKEANNLKQKLNHQEKLEQVKSSKEKPKLKKRHFL